MDLLLILLFLLFLVLFAYKPLPLSFFLSHSLTGIILFVASFMLITEELRNNGVITNIAVFLIRKTKNDYNKSITLFLLLSGIVSSFVMNDVAIFVFTPLSMTLARIMNVKKYKLVSLTVIAINIGSALTPIGNPQNIIMWKYFDIDFFSFIAAMLPFYALLTVLLIVYARYLIKLDERQMTTLEYITMDTKKALIAVFLMIGVIILSELGYDLLGFITTVVTIGVMDRRIFKFINLSTLAIIFFMISDFKMLADIIIPIKINNPILLFIISDILSQVISNVPSTCLLLSCSSNWISLAYGVNHGGIGLFIGSLANIIALKLSDVNINDFHKISLPFYSITFFVLLPLVLLFYII